MNRFVNQLIVASLFVPPVALLAQQVERQVEALPLAQLEQRRADIDNELNGLAHYSLRSGIGSIGFRSRPHATAEHQEWIEIELAHESPIDEIMLLPAIRRDTQEGFQADGFPAEFRITVGTASNRPGTVVGEYSSTNGVLPRIAPLVSSANGLTASWVRIEATRLSQRAFDHKYVLQLSEIVVFSGERNVALRQPVRVSSHHLERGGSSWSPRFLTDGHMPYLMDAAHGQQSVAYIGTRAQQASLTIDLGAAVPLSGIHLHTLDQSDTVPQAYAGDLGIPQHLRIDGANLPDFSDAVLLLENRRGGINSTGPIMMWRLPETMCRYVKLTGSITKSDSQTEPFRIGFAEIELLSHDKNVALGKTVSTDLVPYGKQSIRSLTALTDGRNLYGDVLPIREWMLQLARRHDLEVERPLVADELSRRYARQKANLHQVSWLALLLAAAVAFTILIDRSIRRREIGRMRTRFAADLHDELGADLHVISLLGNLADAAVNSPDKLKLLHQRIRTMTTRASTAVRYSSNMLEAKGLYEDLEGDMQRSTERIMADFERDFTVTGGEHLKALKPRTRADLFLFYKECLVNISRHSEATRIIVRLAATPQGISLTVSDNGQGTEGVPSSLKRRARLIRARVTTTASPSGGTCITLSLNSRKWRRWR